MAVVTGGPGARHRAPGGGLPPALPALGLAVLFLLDTVTALRDWPVAVVGLLDEPAHLITAALVLAAVPALHRHWSAGWVLLGAVVIDLDHVPLFLLGGPVAETGGRPVTHGLLTVLALASGAAVRRPWRAPLLGLATGVLLHLARDVAGGPGAPLLWPLADTGVRVPYPVYAGVLVLVTVVATLVALRAARTASRP